MLLFARQGQHQLHEIVLAEQCLAGPEFGEQPVAVALAAIFHAAIGNSGRSLKTRSRGRAFGRIVDIGEEQRRMIGIVDVAADVKECVAARSLSILLVFGDIFVALVIKSLDRGGADEGTTGGHEGAILGEKRARIPAAVEIEFLNVIKEYLFELKRGQHFIDGELTHNPLLLVEVFISASITEAFNCNEPGVLMRFPPIGRIM